MGRSSSNEATALVKERNRIKKQVTKQDEHGEMDGILKNLERRITSISSETTALVEECNRIKMQLTKQEDLVTLDGILDTYLDFEEGKRPHLVLMEASKSNNRVIHTF